jgi:hypothetical protein
MKGFALPVVLFLLGIGGALSAGGTFVARQVAATHRAIARSATIDGLAEEWAARTIAGWDTSMAVSVGSVAALPDITAGEALVHRWLARPDSSVYWVVVDVSAFSKPLLRRRLGATVLRSGNGLLPVGDWGWVDLH